MYLNIKINHGAATHKRHQLSTHTCWDSVDAWCPSGSLALPTVPLSVSFSVTLSATYRPTDEILKVPVRTAGGGQPVDPAPSPLLNGQERPALADLIITEMGANMHREGADKMSQ